MNRTEAREFKAANGEIVKLTEAEFQNVVDLFRQLSETDRRIMIEAVNGAKVSLTPLGVNEIRKYIGKKVFVAIAVKEQLQMKDWDFYYKLERVTLEGYSAKTNLMKIKAPNEFTFEIEPRGIFVEN